MVKNLFSKLKLIGIDRIHTTKYFLFCISHKNNPMEISNQFSHGQFLERLSLFGQYLKAITSTIPIGYSFIWRNFQTQQNICHLYPTKVLSKKMQEIPTLDNGSKEIKP